MLSLSLYCRGLKDRKLTARPIYAHGVRIYNGNEMRATGASEAPARSNAAHSAHSACTTRAQCAC